MFLSGLRRFFHCAPIAAKPVSAEQQAEIIALQRYCNKQRQNDKTRRVLEKADWQSITTTVLLIYLSQQDLRKVYMNIKLQCKHYLNPLECLAWEVTSKTESKLAAVKALTLGYINNDS